MKSQIHYFTELTDPSRRQNKGTPDDGHHLYTIAAVICGAETWNDMEQYGKSRQERLGKYLDLPNGIPAHDTFNRFFSALDPKAFEAAFLSWIKDISALTAVRTTVTFRIVVEHFACRIYENKLMLSGATRTVQHVSFLLFFES